MRYEIRKKFTILNICKGMAALLSFIKLMHVHRFAVKNIPTFIFQSSELKWNAFKIIAMHD